MVRMPRFTRRAAAAALAALVALVAAATSEASKPPPQPPTFERLCGQVAATFDTTRGGYVTSDGLPLEGAMELGFAIARDGGDAAWLESARYTLRWTIGLYDSTGGGFHTRERDADPLSTRWDKSTIPNARRLENIVDAWKAGDEEMEGWAARIADYFDRVLLDARGGFIAGQVGDRDLVPEANGFAIHAWLVWGAANGDSRTRDFALKSLDRVWESCWNDGIGLLHRDPLGQLIRLPALPDQVEMGRAYVLATHLGGREGDLARAKTLGDLVLQRFQDPEKGGFSSQAHLKAGKVKRSSRDFDENARAVRFLAELAKVSGDPKYREAARVATQSFNKDFEKPGNAAADWALALRALQKPEFPARPEWKEAPNRRPPTPRTIVFPARRPRKK